MQMTTLSASLVKIVGIQPVSFKDDSGKEKKGTRVWWLENPPQDRGIYGQITGQAYISKVISNVQVGDSVQLVIDIFDVKDKSTIRVVDLFKPVATK